MDKLSADFKPQENFIRAKCIYCGCLLTKKQTLAQYDKCESCVRKFENGQDL